MYVNYKTIVMKKQVYSPPLCEEVLMRYEGAFCASKPEAIDDGFDPYTIEDEEENVTWIF